MVEACQMYSYKKSKNCPKLWINLAIFGFFIRIHYTCFHHPGVTSHQRSHPASLLGSNMNNTIATKGQHTCHKVKVNYLKSLLSLEPDFTLVLIHIKPYQRQFSDWAREFRGNEQLSFFSYYFNKLLVSVIDSWFFLFITNYSVHFSLEAPVAQW